MTSLPGWDSIETSRWLHDFFELGGIILFLVVVAFELLGYFYGHRKDSLIEEAARVAVSTQQQATQEEEKRHSLEVEALKQRLAEAGNKIAQLDQSRQPRHLKEDEKAKLAAFFSGKPPASLTIKASLADDGKAYAEEIAGVLRASPLNWTVTVDAALFTGSDTKGTWLTIKDANDIPALAPALQDAFRNAGIPLRDSGVFDPGVPTTADVWLAIGIR
jgi:hypothetical protein